MVTQIVNKRKNKDLQQVRVADINDMYSSHWLKINDFHHGKLTLITWSESTHVHCWLFLTTIETVIRGVIGSVLLNNLQSLGYYTTSYDSAIWALCI